MSPTALGCEEIRKLAAGFVLNALDASEMSAVREHLATCPEAHDEFAELGGVVPYLADVVEPVEPPEGLWARIRASAAADVRAGQRDDLAADRLIAALGRAPLAPPAAAPGQPPSPAVGRVELDELSSSTPAAQPRRSSRPWRQRLSGLPAPAWALAVAAVLVIAVLGAGNALLQGDVAASRDYAARLDHALALASVPGSRAAILASAEPGGATGFAVVPATGDGILVVHDLPPTSGSQVYEAWVIAGSGPPVPAGSFRVGTDGRGWLDALARPPSLQLVAPLVVALTREPGPGATRPTPPILVSGNASPASQAS